MSAAEVATAPALCTAEPIAGPPEVAGETVALPSAMIAGESPAAPGTCRRDAAAVPVPVPSPAPAAAPSPLDAAVDAAPPTVAPVSDESDSDDEGDSDSELAADAADDDEPPSSAASTSDAGGTAKPAGAPGDLAALLQHRAMQAIESAKQRNVVRENHRLAELYCERLVLRAAAKLNLFWVEERNQELQRRARNDRRLDRATRRRERRRERMEAQAAARCQERFEAQQAAIATAMASVPVGVGTGNRLRAGSAAAQVGDAVVREAVARHEKANEEYEEVPGAGQVLMMLLNRNGGGQPQRAGGQGLGFPPPPSTSIGPFATDPQDQRYRNGNRAGSPDPRSPAEEISLDSLLPPRPPGAGGIMEAGQRTPAGRAGKGAARGGLLSSPDEEQRGGFAGDRGVARPQPPLPPPPPTRDRERDRVGERVVNDKAGYGTKPTAEERAQGRLEIRRQAAQARAQVAAATGSPKTPVPEGSPKRGRDTPGSGRAGGRAGAGPPNVPPPPPPPPPPPLPPRPPAAGSPVANGRGGLHASPRSGLSHGDEPSPSDFGLDFLLPSFDFGDDDCDRPAPPSLGLAPGPIAAPRPVTVPAPAGLIVPPGPGSSSGLSLGPIGPPRPAESPPPPGLVAAGGGSSPSRSPGLQGSPTSRTNKVSRTSATIFGRLQSSLQAGGEESAVPPLLAGPFSRSMLPGISSIWGPATTTAASPPLSGSPWDTAVFGASFNGGSTSSFGGDPWGSGAELLLPSDAPALDSKVVGAPTAASEAAFQRTVAISAAAALGGTPVPLAGAADETVEDPAEGAADGPAEGTAEGGGGSRRARRSDRKRNRRGDRGADAVEDQWDASAQVVRETNGSSALGRPGELPEFFRVSAGAPPVLNFMLEHRDGGNNGDGSAALPERAAQSQRRRDEGGGAPVGSGAGTTAGGGKGNLGADGAASANGGGSAVGAAGPSSGRSKRSRNRHGGGGGGGGGEGAEASVRSAAAAGSAALPGSSGAAPKATRLPAKSVLGSGWQ